MRYRKGFTKTVYGYFEIEAKNKQDAENRISEADEFDNKSDYVCDDDWEEVE